VILALAHIRLNRAGQSVRGRLVSQVGILGRSYEIIIRSRMPYQSNLERNAVIYQYWQEGKTIEEISTLTGIPHSTVGYYARKFNAAARAGMPLPLPPPSKKQPAEIEFSFLQKHKVMEFLLNLIKTNDAQTIYYNLASMKLLTELFGRLALTKEERELLSSALSVAQQAQPTVQRQGPKLTELFPNSTTHS